MPYTAWVRYGTSNDGCDEYLATSAYSGELMLTTLRLDHAQRFATLEEAKEAVHEWCIKRRAQLEKIGFHSGKAWNQTREGAWHYKEVEELEDPRFPGGKPTTIYEF